MHDEIVRMLADILQRREGHGRCETWRGKFVGVLCRWLVRLSVTSEQMFTIT